MGSLAEFLTGFIATIVIVLGSLFLAALKTGLLKPDKDVPQIDPPSKYKYYRDKWIAEGNPLDLDRMTRNLEG